MGKKGLNNVVAKSSIVKTIGSSLEEIKDQRWLASEDGQDYLRHEKEKARLEIIRRDFIIGQLVWQDDILDDSDDESAASETRVISRCSKLLRVVDEEKVELEMLYGIWNGVKYDSYKDFTGYTWQKGSKYTLSFQNFEKHVARITNKIWWKVL